MKRLKFLVIGIILITMMFPLETFAEKHQDIVSNKFYYIKHVESGRLLDIDSEHVNDNGTQLQIWDKWTGHQNQVFGLVDTGRGWKIYTYPSKKILEVRNSSHSDYTEVAQWDDHNKMCGCWNIIYNSDGTISFQNCESGLYMNVFNNNTVNGSKVIQYHSDETTAEKFELQMIKMKDVLSASWVRKISDNEIKWSDIGQNFNIINMTEWSKERKYPTEGHEYLQKIEYMDPKTVGEIIKSRAYVNDAWTQIKEVVTGEATQETITMVLNKLGIGEVPFLGGGLSILEVIWNNEKNKDWNNFLDTVQYDSNGRCSGIIIYSYKCITKNKTYGKKYNATVGTIEEKIVIADYEKKVYQRWSGDDFETVRYNTNNMKGAWEYNFK